MEYIKTAGMADDDIQRIRNVYLGASEIGVALNFNPFRTPHNLWRQKTNAPGFQRFKGNEFTKWGLRLENSIGLGFAADYECKIRKDNKIRLHSSRILSCSLDRVISSQKGRPKRDGPGILEIKNMSQFAYDKYRKSELEIPLHYYAQHQQQFQITGYKWGYFILLVGGNELIVKEMKPDTEYQKKQSDFAIKWWDRHVIGREEPRLDAADAKDPDEVELIEGAIEASRETYALYEKHRNVSEKIKELTKVKDEIQGNLIEELGNSMELTFMGGTLAKWSEYKAFNSKQLKADDPELYEEYKTNQIRRFNISRSYKYEPKN